MSINQPLLNKNILITGAARRVGKAMALAVAGAGANVVIHYGSSGEAARATQQEIQDKGGTANLLQADLTDLDDAAILVEKANAFGTLHAIIHNASIFEPLSFEETTLEQWEQHMRVHATSPFLISQTFAAALPPGETGRIVTMLDWRVLRPAADHFPYTVSKAALVTLTRSLAVALAPRITVNGIALGAILPPADGGDTPGLLKMVPANRWAALDEVTDTLLFLLTGPTYITGEIIHVDGGRHLL